MKAKAQEEDWDLDKIKQAIDANLNAIEID